MSNDLDRATNLSNFGPVTSELDSSWNYERRPWSTRALWQTILSSAGLMSDELAQYWTYERQPWSMLDLWAIAWLVWDVWGTRLINFNLWWTNLIKLGSMSHDLDQLCIHAQRIWAVWDLWATNLINVEPTNLNNFGPMSDELYPFGTYDRWTWLIMEL